MAAFDETLRLERVDNDPHRLIAHTDPAFNNMVGPYGGATAATIIAAISDHPDVLGDPLALTVNFTAALTLEPYEITLQVARTNRTNQHWIVVITQDSEITTTATAVFGVRRDSWSSTELTPPPVNDPESYERLRFPEYIAWQQNYDMRFVEGPITDGPTAPADDSVTTMWARQDPDRPLDFAALTALSDSFYPRIFRRLGQYVPAGTISITTYFHADAAALARQGTDYVLATVTGNTFGHGHFDHSGSIWSRSGELLATTHQLVYYKAPPTAAN